MGPRGVLTGRQGSQGLPETAVVQSNSASGTFGFSFRLDLPLLARSEVDPLPVL